MKGSIKITVTEVTEDRFPLTKTFIIEEDNTPESIEWWIVAFRKILYAQTFHPNTINEFIPDPDDEPIDSNRN